jgi:hypothetical protein
VLGNLHAAFGGGPGEKGWEQYLACGLSDWVLGFSGPKAEAEEIKREIRDFLRETLKLELSEEKTLVTHIRTCAAKFLGYEIVSQHVDDKLDRRGQRQVNETIGLRVPKAVIEQKCAMYMRRGKPAQRAPLIRESDYSILGKYQAEYRGIVQYYLLAHNVAWFGKLYWVAITYPCLRVEIPEFKKERMRGVPPAFVGPASMQTPNLQIESHFSACKTPKGDGLTKLPAQLSIRAL